MKTTYYYTGTSAGHTEHNRKEALALASKFATELEAQDATIVQDWDDNDNEVWTASVSTNNDAYQHLGDFKTEEEAQKAADGWNETAEAERLKLVSFEVPENLHKLDPCFDAEFEKRKDFAYLQEASCQVTIDGNTYRAEYLGMTHDLDGDRIAFSAGLFSEVADGLAALLDDLEAWEHDEDDEDGDYPLTYSASYIDGEYTPNV